MMNRDSYSDLETWDISKMKMDSTVMIIGKRGTGKSTKLKYMMSIIGQYFRKGCVLRGVDTDDYLYVPRLYMHDVGSNFDPGFLAKLIVMQERRTQEFKMDPSQTEPPRVFLILDDVGSNPKIMKNEFLRWIFSNGRHIYVTVFVMCQYLKQMPKELRENLDYMIMLNLKSVEMRKYIQRNHLGFINKFEDFNNIYNEATADNGALVFYDNKSNSIKKCLFKMHIPSSAFVNGKLLDNFVVGCAKYRRVSERHYYNKDKEEMEDEINKKLRRRNRRRKRRERKARLAQNGGTGYDACKVSTIGTESVSSILSASSVGHPDDDDKDLLHYHHDYEGGGGGEEEEEEEEEEDYAAHEIVHDDYSGAAAENPPAQLPRSHQNQQQHYHHHHQPLPHGGGGNRNRKQQQQSITNYWSGAEFSADDDDNYDADPYGGSSRNDYGGGAATFDAFDGGDFPDLLGEFGRSSGAAEREGGRRRGHYQQQQHYKTTTQNNHAVYDDDEQHADRSRRRPSHNHTTAATTYSPSRHQNKMQKQQQQQIMGDRHQSSSSGGRNKQQHHHGYQQQPPQQKQKTPVCWDYYYDEDQASSAYSDGVWSEQPSATSLLDLHDMRNSRAMIY